MLSPRVKETTTSTGTGDITLAGAATNFKTFYSAFGTTRRFSYMIEDTTNNTWEEGIGILTSSTNMTRSVITANSSGTTSAISFGSGTKNVYCSSSSDTSIPVVERKSNDWSVSGNLTFAEAGTIWVEANALVLFPFLWDQRRMVDALGIYVQTAQAGSKLRIGIYESGSNGLPSNLIQQTSDLDSSSTGFKYSTFSPIRIDRIVWAGLVSNSSSVQVNGSSYQYTLPRMGGGDGYYGFTDAMVRQYISSGWTSLPSTFAIYDATTNTSTSRILMRGA